MTKRDKNQFNTHCFDDESMTLNEREPLDLTDKEEEEEQPIKLGDLNDPSTWEVL